MALEKIWVERYRPQCLADVVFANDTERKYFETIVQNKTLPNLLLVGVQGTGKTTLSQVLINELKVHPEDVMKQNCSNKKIDAIRDEVLNFAYTMPMGNFRVVRLEEFDGISLDAQKLLRSVIEEVEDNCRFILTANYVNKILPPLRSRLNEFVFSKPDKDSILLRTAEILEKQSVDFEVDDLEKVVSAAYPDIRKTIHILEASSKSGKLVINTESENLADWKLGLIPLLEKDDLVNARKLVCSAAAEEISEVFPFLYNNVHRIKSLKGKEDQAIVLIADYQYKNGFVDSQEINVAALFIELGAL